MEARTLDPFEETELWEKAPLWQAAHYQHPVTGRCCSGKIHVLRPDDPARTVCGRYTSALGGTALVRNEGITSTCEGCRNSIAARVRSVTLQAQYVAEQQRADEEWHRRYEEYLKTPAWHARRSRVLHRAGHLCEGCGEHRATQAHHLHYQRLGHEMLFDLVAVCEACHRSIHQH
jgi:hypothetical protein